jgi:hypothetical protein
MVMDRPSGAGGRGRIVDELMDAHASNGFETM